MKGKDLYRDLIERSKSAVRIGLFAYLFGVVTLYTVGCLTGMNARYGRSLWQFEDDVWSVTHCLYQAGITFTTVGYTDELGTDSVLIYRHPTTDAFYAWNSHDGLRPAPGAEEAAIDDLVLHRDYSTVTTLTTVFVAVTGMGVFIYAIGAITAFFVEGAWLELRMSKRVRMRIGRLRGHVIVCGAGPTGLFAIERFLDEHVPILAIDDDDTHLDFLRERHPDLLYLRGDPTDYVNLQDAGLEHARGIVTALPEDNDNLVVIVTVRQLRPDIRILSRAGEIDEVHRLAKAGANEVVTPPAVGGMRLASEAIRPTVVQMIDEFLGHEAERRGFRFCPLEIEAGTAACGRTLGAIRFGDRTGLRVLALRRPGEEGFRYNPGPDLVLEEGSLLAVVADEAALARARSLLEQRPEDDA